MVDLIPIRKLYVYTKLERVDTSAGRVYKIDGNEHDMPSVTRILSATKDRAHLDAWAARVGEEEAERIKNEAATIGTHMHNVIERMIAYRDLPRPTNWLMTKGYEMGYKLINTYFPYMSEIWGSEVPLYYPGEYAGTTDFVGVYRGRPAIVDFKQSVKPKRAEWIEDYFHQLAAYALAHDIIHGTNIDFGAVLVCVQNGTTQEFTTTGREFQNHKDAWMKRVEQFKQQAVQPPETPASD
jgi:genome maintenance exonuclease 1